MTKVSTYQIRAFERRATTIWLKAQALAADINEAFGNESSISDFADDVLCTAETLEDGLKRLPSVLKNGGHP